LSFIRLGEFDLANATDCCVINGVKKCAEKPQEVYKSDFDIVSHINYSSYEGTNDIALIKLKTPANIQSNVRPICLPFNEEKVPSNKLQVIGFGYTHNSPSRHSDVLMEAIVDSYDHERCKEIYEVTRNLSENNFCAMSTKKYVTKSGYEFSFDIGTCQGRKNIFY
jgi:hypothetical protein